MAYGACFWGIVQTFLWAALAVLFPGTLSAMGAVIGWSYGLTTTVIVGYFGNTAVEEAMKRRRNGGQ